MSYYTGAPVPQLFMDRWRSNRAVGAGRPWAGVWIRRGRFARTYHTNWPNPQFGQVVGRSIRHQWYPDWTPLDDWTLLPGVGKIDLSQSFANNGSTVATVDCDNVAWRSVTGPGGAYHEKQRGLLWPWRGYTPPNRPGSGLAKNDWYNRLPNAQILIRQGYGPDAQIKTFTGLVDGLKGSIRPDHLTLTCRDFGGALSDQFVFGWNKDKNINTPIVFVPPNYKHLKNLKAGAGEHRWIIVKDACDIVRCALRFCGFKDWQIQDSGVTLSQPYRVEKSKSWADVINDVATQLGYVFFIAEPDQNDDLSIGTPIFRSPTVLQPAKGVPLTIRDTQLLTDMQPSLDNSNDRYIIRVRGQSSQTKTGASPQLDADRIYRFNFTYWPPWMSRMAGVIKQLTYYNIGASGVLGYTSNQQCSVAALLIAVQISLGRYTTLGQCPGNPALGLDGFAYVIDSGTGVTSRVYITNRQSTMTLGGDGSALITSGYSSGGAASNDLLWATQFGGALCDNPEWERVISDYHKAVSGKKVISSGTPT